MTVDYDFVILGGSSAARSAAIAAAQLKARVALVEPDRTSMLPESMLPESLFHHSFLATGRLFHQMQQATAFGLSECSSAATVRLSDLRQRSTAIAEAMTDRLLPVLAALGVDVIFGQAEFYRCPRLGVRVSGRDLRSRRYLIAPGTRLTLPAIDGLKSAGFVTLDSLDQSPVGLASPHHFVVIGSEPGSIAVAQTIARLGARVTLIVQSAQILPAADAEAANLIQAQLEADGVGILTQTTVTQVKQLDGKKWLQANDQALEADEIVLGITQQPDLDSLNLDAAGVKWQPSGIAVNTKLQTTNPHIYACGSALAGSAAEYLAKYEATIALKNALFFPRWQVDYRPIPTALLTQPELAQVGITEAQARRRYGKAIHILRQFYKALPRAQIQGELTGFCKLIVRHNGEILGAHLVGAVASEMIEPIALAMQQKLSIQALARLTPISPTWTELLHHTACQWAQRDRSSWLEDCLENWFNLRRSWTQ
jgi:pyruvate/2-oxoglutarate dehydrogenase complex dihydrolipoamide dehydrogenase (E3) component